MSKCLVCFKSIENGASIMDLVMNHDIICPTCRKSMKQVKEKFMINKIGVKSFYVYNDFYSSLLIQYKECMDEALAPVFIYPFRLWIRIRYAGYTIVPLPSSETKYLERGFSHVSKMFEGCGLNIVACLLKDSSQKQARLSKKEREEMSSHIQCIEGMHVPKKILLVDDVCTTGNTIKGALSALGSHPCHVKILVIAAHPLNFKSKKYMKL